MQLSLFGETERTVSVMCILCDENFNSVKNLKGELTVINEEFTKMELKEFAFKSPVAIRKRYVYSVYGYIKGKPVEILIRFINETTKAKESVLEFIDRAFYVAELSKYDYEAFRRLKGF